jgi:hypothetical protein
VPPKGVLEIPECGGSVDCRQEIFVNRVGHHREREILHDLPLVDIELRGKLLEAAAGGDALGNLPFVFLPVRKIRLLVA